MLSQACGYIKEFKGKTLLRVSVLRRTTTHSVVTLSDSTYFFKNQTFPSSLCVEQVMLEEEVSIFVVVFPSPV